MAAGSCIAKIADDLDFTTFDHKYMRRNPLYRSEYSHVAPLTTSLDPATRVTEIARAWGLAFPVPAR